MPAFVANGPDIPELLLQRHEDGRVVFFCGAGISKPAGLPSFSGLVDRIYHELGISRTSTENQLDNYEQPDATLHQLERFHPGQRRAVRTALEKILKPNWRKKNALTTHWALLQLATDRKGRVRLVTTNFDRIFQRVITRYKFDIPYFAAPLLPIPKPTRWHGVVHLHGLLPEVPDEEALNRLVLTSGDFGLAYLTERWAARFVSELFRNYTVCFVGYSINDPVMRYMMDALAADELLGEARPEAYAFASFDDGDKAQALSKWEAKGVTPLLYESPVGENDHSALHRTLKEWADTYRDGVRGKEMIVAQHATTRPLASSRSDFAVGRVLWALTDGLAARHFADLNPVPPLEWLEPLAEAQFNHDDLPRFGVVPNPKKNDKLSFSIIQRPTPYTHAPKMCIADMGSRGSDWDAVMHQIARWLARHLDDPRLLLWLVKQGCQLHEQFAWLIRHRITEINELELNDKKDEITRIRADALMAVPGPSMRTLWRLVLSNRLKSHSHDFSLYQWIDSFKQDGLTPTLRMELRELLTPRTILRDRIHMGEQLAYSCESKRIKDLVDWEIVLTSDHVHTALRDLENNAEWEAALPDLLQDFTLQLRDTLDLMQELGGADSDRDLSYYAQPSISKHPQNRDFHDWTALIDLTRDAWLAMTRKNPEQAKLVAEGWWHVQYPLFKRLVFFAGANSNIFAPIQILNYLLAERHWWLWSVETQREAIRLLLVLATSLDALGMKELEQAILQGPPRDMFRDSIELDEWKRIVDHGIWLRLAKMKAIGVVLNQDAKARLDELDLLYPRWKLAQDDRDEFPFWMDSGWGYSESPPPEFELAPPSRTDLKNWLIKHPSADRWYHEDGWSKLCRDNFTIAAGALSDLVQEEQWPTDRWRNALQIAAEDSVIKQSWPILAIVLSDAPDFVIQELAHSLSWWLEKQSKLFDGHDELFFKLIRRLLALEYKDEAQSDDPVFQAINHPVGHATEALLNWWYRQEPQGSEGLRTEVKLPFTALCDKRNEKFRHGRVLLAAHTIALFRVDEEWTKVSLLPLFDWRESTAEARLAWEGFLWSPRLYRPLLSVIKQPLLETAKHYGELGKHAKQYAAFLTFAALDPGDTFTTQELADATHSLPIDGLQNVAQALVRALEGASELRGEYWHNRVLRYLHDIWPKARDIITPVISESFARLCIAAKEGFPEALEELQYWLQPVEHPDYVVQLMSEAKLCEQFPSEALTFLNTVIGDDVHWTPRKLKQCLDSIEKVAQELANDHRFIRLTVLIRRRGIS